MFWFYPSGQSSPPTVVDLGRTVSSLFWEPLRSSSGGVSVGGDFVTVSWEARLRVTVAMGPFNATGALADVPHKLESMSTHLERGGVVAFAADSALAYFGALTSLPVWGDTSLTTYGNIMASLTGAPVTLPTGEVLVVESDNPEGNREYHRLASHPSASSLTLQTPVGYEYAGPLAWVRQRDTFPVLYLPRDRVGVNLLTTDNRNTWTLDVTLEQGIAGMAEMVSRRSGDMLTEVGSDRRQSGMSLDSAVRATSSPNLDLWRRR